MMNQFRVRSLTGVVVLGFLALAADARAQEGTASRPQDGPATRVNRETMWPAPTAEDWKKPCLIKWQRTWEDAQAVSKETGKPILVCVNMDGEVASEHYAGVRYRQPEIARLYEPYVTVIASVYRHNPRDFDEQGRRILCPRFGSVTCGEHIAIEPGLYDKFMDGRRVAPRHIGVELDGKEMYDVYYAWDTDTIFNALRKGIADRPPVPDVVRGDRPITERVGSNDNQDRVAVEKAYLEGDQGVRRALLDAAVARGAEVPVDLLRLAVFGFDAELGKVARRALAQSNSEGAVDLITEALRVPMEVPEREALVNALGRIGEKSPRAKTMAVVQQGLTTRSGAIDVEAWMTAVDGDGDTGRARATRAGGTLAHALASAAAEGELAEEVVQSRLDHRHETLASKDPVACLELAEALISRAARDGTDAEFARFLAADANEVAQLAEKLGAPAPRTSAVLAVTAFWRGDYAEAHKRAEIAVTALPAEPRGRTGMLVLGLFAAARQRSIGKAVDNKTEWPREWIADVHAAYDILAHHPLGNDTHVAAHHDFLKWFGAYAQANRVLEEGLTRFADSAPLHARLRDRIVKEKGVDGLEPVYDAMLKKGEPTASLHWFAGYAAHTAAEFHRRQGHEKQALAAYDRAVVHFEDAIRADPDDRARSDESIAVAIAGRARVDLEAKDYERAVADVLASFARRPDAAAKLDGMNISAVDTAKMLLARLKEAKRDDLAAQVEAALAKLPPDMLRLPAYERETPGGPPADSRANRRPPRRQGG